MRGQDFKYLVDRRKPRRRRYLRYTLLVATICMVAIAIATATHSDASIGNKPTHSNKAVDHIEKPKATARHYIPLALPPNSDTQKPAQPQAHTEGKLKTIALDVRRGDTLTSLLAQVGMGDATSLLIKADTADERLSRLRPGQKIEIAIKHGTLQRLDMPSGDTTFTRFLRNGNAYRPHTIERHYEHRLTQVHGVIRESLFIDGQKAGLSNAQIMEMAEIFGWDIDFAQDLRPGDRFTVVLEALYNASGEKAGEGHIQAAEFTTQGRRHVAIRYRRNGHADYYSPDGHNLRKAFLRTPVAFTRISSRFGMRKHPILNRIRAHKGVDYAAPMGTPVRASGDGKAVFIGWKGGYGRVVVLHHGQHYSTVYGHLSRFAHGLKAGTHVRQGQVIAYVGRSGLATGPHLHYEFRVDGVHRNPLTVALPAAQPLPTSDLSDFQARAQPLVAMLTTYRNTAIAMNGPTP